MKLTCNLRTGAFAVLGFLVASTAALVVNSRLTGGMVPLMPDVAGVGIFQLGGPNILCQQCMQPMMQQMQQCGGKVGPALANCIGKVMQNATAACAAVCGMSSSGGPGQGGNTGPQACVRPVSDECKAVGGCVAGCKGADVQCTQKCMASCFEHPWGECEGGQGGQIGPGQGGGGQFSNPFGGTGETQGGRGGGVGGPDWPTGTAVFQSEGSYAPPMAPDVVSGPPPVSPAGPADGYVEGGGYGQLDDQGLWRGGAGASSGGGQGGKGGDVIGGGGGNWWLLRDGRIAPEGGGIGILPGDQALQGDQEWFNPEVGLMTQQMTPLAALCTEPKGCGIFCPPSECEERHGIHQPGFLGRFFFGLGGSCEPLPEVRESC